MRYHLTPVRMTIINKSTNNRCWWDVEKKESSCTVGGNPHALLVGMQVCAATVENTMVISQKIKGGSAFWLSDPTFGNISAETQKLIQKTLALPCSYQHYLQSPRFIFLSFLKNIVYWLCYYSCPIFPPLFPSALHIPSYLHSSPLVHVRGSYI